MSAITVTTDDGTTVITKKCPRCRKTKRCTVGKDSDFWLKREGGRIVGWQSYCKTCSKTHRAQYQADNKDQLNRQSNARYHERMETDPEFRRRHNEASARATAKWLATPEGLATSRRQARESVRRRKARDPEGYAEVKRMEYVLRRERMGKTVRPRTTVIDGTQPRIPAEPFRRWLVEYACLVGYTSENDTGGVDIAVEALAEDLRIHPKRVSTTLAKTYKRVSLDVVCRALVEARVIVMVGDTTIYTLDDLYPEDGSKERAETAQRTETNDGD